MHMLNECDMHDQTYVRYLPKEYSNEVSKGFKNIFWVIA